VTANFFIARRVNHSTAAAAPEPLLTARMQDAIPRGTGLAAGNPCRKRAHVRQTSLSKTGPPSTS
jgi:hypothetical protein